MCWWGCVWLNALKNKSTGTTIEFASKQENKREQYCDFFHREEACGSEQEETSMRSALLWNYIRSSWYLTWPRASGQGGFESEMVHRRYFFFTFSKEYWQLAMTRQNWKTQKSLKQPWFRSTKPRKETRKAMKTATRFSRTSWFLYEDMNRLDSVAFNRFQETNNDNNQKFAGRFFCVLPIQKGQQGEPVI